MAEEVLVVFTTWPDAVAARAAARVFVEERLAACANLVPAIESIYRWEGKVETASEVWMILKTTIGRYPQLEARIKALHSYEVPEIVSLRVTDGLPAYLRWVEASCV
ncbi:MAG: divalent-cation tolerance protein CutA [Chthoniobacteraceae bacterium]